MKVAIVSFFMMESTIPLAKHLSSEKTQIDLFSLLPYGCQNTYVYDFVNNKQKNGFVNEGIARITLGEKLYNYLSGINFSIFIYPDRWFQKIFFKDLYFAYILASRLKKNKYDLIHIIHTSARFWLFLYFFLGKKKVVQTLHEVTSHESKTNFLDSLCLKTLVRKTVPIIFHSNISKERFIRFRETFSNTDPVKINLAVIQFGLFKTYECFSQESKKSNESDEITILNFGRIVPSKGIHFLIEAIKLLQDKYPIHLIIAGAGEPYFSLKEIKSYEFLNRFITNKEIVELIKRCDMVVLPYTSASQSGIPMTVFNFNKPIIASNIAGFKEVIDNLQTGILINNLNSQSLAASIEVLLLDKKLRMQMAENIKNKYSAGEFSWCYIAAKTLNFYQDQISN